MPAKYKIVMIRHGESEWNQKNLFCGWFDADLSPKGKFYPRCLYILIYEMFLRFIIIFCIFVSQGALKQRRLVRL